MRTVATLFLALVAVQHSSAIPTDEEKAMFLKMAKLCVEETKLPADELEQFKKMELPESPAAKCFVACIMEQIGVFKDGELVQEGIDAFSEKLFAGNPEKIAKAKEEAAKCRVETDALMIADRCEKAFTAKKCIRKTIDLA